MNRQKYKILIQIFKVTCSIGFAVYNTFYYNSKLKKLDIINHQFRQHLILVEVVSAV